MIQEKINSLLKGQAFDNDLFAKHLSNSTLRKRYSISDMTGESIFCFFFYQNEYLIETFQCNIKTEQDQEKLHVYQYRCRDTGRADCWKWVDVA